MTFLEANYGNIIVLSLVLLLLYVCARSLFSSKGQGCPSCAGKSCNGCSLCASASDLKKMVKEGRL